MCVVCVFARLGKAAASQDCVAINHQTKRIVRERTHTAGTMDTMDIKGKRLHRNTLKALLAVTHSDCAAHLRVLLPNLNISSRSCPLSLSLSLSLWAWLDLRPDPIAQMPAEDLAALMRTIYKI